MNIDFARAPNSPGSQSESTKTVRTAALLSGTAEAAAALVGRCAGAKSSWDSSPKRCSPVLVLVVAALLFSAMALVAKRAAFRLPGPEVACVRFLVGLLVVAVVALRVRLQRRNTLGLFLRGLYGGTAVLLYFMAIDHLPVGIATLLNYTSPVFTAIYAAFVLRERVTALTASALGLACVGVLLVLKGSAPSGSFGVGVWELVGLASAVFAGAAVATIREVRKTDGSWEVFAAFCLGGAALTVGPAYAGWVAPTPYEWGALVVVGMLSVLAQVLMTYALRFVQAAQAGVIVQLTPVATMLFGAVLFREPLGGLTALGAALTLIGVGWGATLAASEEPGS